MASNSSTATTRATAPIPAPVAVIGAGPVGLAAAAHLLRVGETPLVLEAGETVGAAARSWGHVRLFSPWRHVVDPVAVTLLEPTGWQLPGPERAPTGYELVKQYLEPLAALPEIAPHLRLSTRVLSVTRRGLDRMKDSGRADAPFVLHVRDSAGREERVLAKAVIDASGTYGSPNPLGAGGVPALGETALAERIFYGIPDVLGAHRARYARRRVLVVGSGHSAFNALLDLVRVAEEEPGTAITWAIRRRDVGQLFGGEERDALPERGRLGTRARLLVERGLVRPVSVRIAELRDTEDGVVVIGEDGEALPPVDELIATTGFRPDPSLSRELRLDLDPSVEAPRALAPLIDPNIHSCGTVPPHGVDELRHPEPGFYVVGMKSYGRAPTFLLLTGYEQVRSVASAIAGDWEAARKVELVLPETGVCSTSTSDGPSCCDAEPDDVPEAIPQLAQVVTSAAQQAASPTPTSVKLPVLASAGAPPTAGGDCCSA
ncbi:MAG TPA: FAD-dependent oxidoreductase [Chloroflexota bacterium]|nr:FAD-dependent oxidoreductase [Chloroflexota bacterium]